MCQEKRFLTCHGGSFQAIKSTIFVGVHRFRVHRSLRAVGPLGRRQGCFSFVNLHVSIHGAVDLGEIPNDKPVPVNT